MIMHKKTIIFNKRTQLEQRRIKFLTNFEVQSIRCPVTLLLLSDPTTNRQLILSKPSLVESYTSLS